MKIVGGPAKTEVSRTAFFAIIAVVAVLVLGVLWRLTAGGGGAASMDADYRRAEAEVIKQGQDPKTVFGLEYYKHHPDQWDKRPAGTGAPIPPVGVSHGLGTVLETLPESAKKNLPPIR